MANSATKESLAAKEAGPDYKGALALILGDISEDKEATSALGQRIGQTWKRIEKQMGLNRKGAQMFAGIVKLAPETQKDILRTFYGLCNEAGYDRFNDLVDRAQSGEDAAAKPKPAPAAPKKAEAPVPPKPPADDSDLAGEEPRVDGLLVRTNLKTGMFEQLIEAGDRTKDSDWKELRKATSTELAAARNEIADFDDKEVVSDPPFDPAAEAAAAKAKVEDAKPRGTRAKLSVVS